MDARATDVRIADDKLAVTLVDGRTLTVPLGWFPRLLNATHEQRAHWKLVGMGEGIHWPDADEDISVAGLLRGERDSTTRAAPSHRR
ncbi:MAG: DUF2442 domain-containing protein [Steroidobacterales bacterium]